MVNDAVGPQSTAREITAALGAERVTRRQLVELALTRCEQVNPLLNAVVTLDAEGALARADALDGDGSAHGALDGLVFTVKDSFDTAGVRSTAGSKDYADRVPSHSAPAVTRLVDADAILLGKTNLPKLAGDLQTNSSLLGRAINPWNPERTTGGSSGGGAAAVATGITVFDLASDHAGSVRIPASYCGVFGYRPTVGLVPLRGHVPPPPGAHTARDLATAGILARHPVDLAMALAVVAGPDGPAGRLWHVQLPPWPDRPLTSYRVGRWLSTDLPLDDEVRGVVEGFFDRLEAAGVAVRDCSTSIDSASINRLFHSLLGATVGPQLDDERFALVEQYLAGAEADDSTYHRDAVAVAQRHRDWLLAKEAQARQAELVERLFGQVDVIVGPATPTTAPEHDDEQDRHARTITVNGQQRPYFDQLAWSGLAGVANLPVVVVPINLASDGLPVGLQVMAASHDDLTALAFAECLTEAGSTLGERPTL